MPANRLSSWKLFLLVLSMFSCSNLAALGRNLCYRQDHCLVHFGDVLLFLSRLFYLLIGTHVVEAKHGMTRLCRGRLFIFKAMQSVLVQQAIHPPSVISLSVR